MNLVKEYNWPDFVGNNSTTHFPYNPEEKVLTASINDYSGTISIVPIELLLLELQFLIYHL